MKGSQNILRVPHISLLFPLTLQTSMDVTTWRLHTCVLFKGTHLMRFLETFGSNCLGYRGQASICTYESTSEHEFHIIIVDKFPPPGPTWHEGFCVLTLFNLLVRVFH